MLVRRIIIGDAVNIQLLRRCPVDRFEEFEELLMTVARCADGPVLAIGDRGPGIPIEERNHVLRRFYRLERSRNRPGNGLGLSLVAAVANLHNARIIMADNNPGLRIELHFPIPQRTTASVFDQQAQSSGVDGHRL